MVLFKYYPAVKKHYNASSKTLKILSQLLKEGRAIPVRPRLMALGDIGKGFEEMKAGKKEERSWCMALLANRGLEPDGFMFYGRSKLETRRAFAIPSVV